MKAYRKQSKRRQLVKKMQKSCTHCQNKGHLIAQCWTLHPTNQPKNLKQEDKNTIENGTKYSIIDVSPNDSQEEDFQKEKLPWKWLGKKWFDFLTQ